MVVRLSQVLATSRVDLVTCGPGPEREQGRENAALWNSGSPKATVLGPGTHHIHRHRSVKHAFNTERNRCKGSNSSGGRNPGAGRGGSTRCATAYYHSTLATVRSTLLPPTFASNNVSKISPLRNSSGRLRVARPRLPGSYPVRSAIKVTPDALRPFETRELFAALDVQVIDKTLERCEPENGATKGLLTGPEGGGPCSRAKCQWQVRWCWP